MPRPSHTPERSALAVQPRVVPRERAAAYLSLSVAAFDEWIREKRIPGPLPGTRRWDLRAIDAALDKVSDLAPPSPLSAYDEWKAQEYAHDGARHP